MENRGPRICSTQQASNNRRKRAAATPEQLAQAKLDNDIEDATIFAAAIGPGWDLKKLPKTKFLVDRIMDIDRAGSRNAKHYFLRDRPWDCGSDLASSIVRQSEKNRD